MRIQVFLIVFSWLFTLISVFSHLMASVNGVGDIFPTSFLLGDVSIDNSLASPNPFSPKQTSTFCTSKIQNILLAFGQWNVIVTALTLLLAILNCGVYRLRRSYESKFGQGGNVQSVPDEPSFRLFSLTEILLATQNFSEALVIGKGGFGKVYKGFIYGRPKIVAIKRLKRESKQGAPEFWREIETLSKLRHMNLVSLLGYCMEREEMILVYDYMPRGTIADNLYKTCINGKNGIGLTWEQRLKICIGAARGLDYLHTGTQHGVIHRDVKDTNILLDENFVAKISDFGLSKLGKIDETEGQLSTNIKGTIGYLDPAYLMTHKPSTKSDIYAFGIVMLVVLSGRPALERSFLSERRSLLSCFKECVRKGEMKEIIDPCLQEDILTESLTRFINVVGNCLHRNPKKRTTMAQVVVHLEHALEEQKGTVVSTLVTETVVGQISPTGSNRLFNFYEMQVAPAVPEEIITSLALPGEGNNTNIGFQNADLQMRAEVLQSKGKYDNVTQKPLWGRPWVSLWNNRKATKKTGLDLQTPNVSSLQGLKFTTQNFSDKLIIGEGGHGLDLQTPNAFSLEALKFATQNFSDKLIIGEGRHGKVYKGFINGGSRIVAIQRRSMRSRQAGEKFQREVDMLCTTTQYIHLVGFVGFCNESKKLIVVNEYMSRGTLDKHLYGDNESRKDDICLTWEQRLRICIGAARGLNHLHELGIIHGDVTASRIMLDENFVAKISGYGLSKYETKEVKGTYPYMDDDYNIHGGRLSKASDVYSLGIVLLVVISGRPKEDFITYEPCDLAEVPISYWFESCYGRRYFNELIDPNLVGRIPSASLIKFLDLIKRCLKFEIYPESPPGVIAQVVVDLEEALNVAKCCPSGGESSRILGTDEKRREQLIFFYNGGL